MKFLITGGTGLIGTGLKTYIEKQDISDNSWLFISSKDCNLLNIEEVCKLFSNYKPDYIIHLAAEVGGLFKNIEQKVKMLENNIIMNYNVLNVAHKQGINNIMCCLSTCIFPDKISYPINEDNLHNGPPHNSNYAYAYAKRLLDIHCRLYREQYGRNYFCIIPTNVYGPNDNFNLEDGHVIPALIHNCYLAKKYNKPFYVKGTGNALRQFIYSKDIGRCIYELAMNYKGCKPVILSVSECDEISIGDVAKIICKYMDYNHIQYLYEYPDGQYKKTVDNNFMLSIMPSDFNFTSIEQGISETIKWFCDNYENARL
jgi:GDP-L-fucose synthase